MKVYTLTTIAHPEFNYTVVQKLQERYKIPNRSIYTNRKRVNRVTNAFYYSDKIFLTVKSKFVVDTFLSHGIPGDKIVPISSNVGIDTAYFTCNKEKGKNESITFLTLADWTLIKGLPLLLDAWIGTVNDSEAMKRKLIIAGGLDEDNRYIIKKYHKVLKNVEFIGNIRCEDIVEVYNRADVFIASSVSDNIPNTAIEAMACGLPVLISNNCGFAEYIEEGRDGFTYDPFDTDKLKVLIKWFINNKPKIPIMSEFAKKKALSFPLTEYLKDLFTECNAELSEVEAGPIWKLEG